MEKPRLWTKDFLLITAANLFYALNFFLLMVTIPVYTIDTFQSSTGEAGLAASIFVIGGILPRLFAGRWIERIGRKKTLYAGLISGMLITLLYFAVNSIAILLVIRFLHGATFGVVTTATNTIAANIIPGETW